MDATQTRAMAPVLEVFASIQGEGAFAGEPQVLLRLAGCPLRCAWCDTPDSRRLVPGASARVDTADGPRRRPGWANPFQAACWVGEADPREPRTLSVTGGEPLLWPEFLLELCRLVRGRRLHLETGGGHPRTLERVIEACDHVSLDLKLPADLGPPGEVPPQELDEGRVAPTAERAPRDEGEWTAARRAALCLLADRDAATKLVVAGGRGRADYTPLLEDQAQRAPRLPLFLQPVTPQGGVQSPSTELLVDVAEDARDLGLVVRVLPQLHRALGVR